MAGIAALAWLAGFILGGTAERVDPAPTDAPPAQVQRDQ